MKERAHEVESQVGPVRTLALELGVGISVLPGIRRTPATKFSPHPPSPRGSPPTFQDKDKRSDFQAKEKRAQLGKLSSSLSFSFYYFRVFSLIELL